MDKQQFYSSLSEDFDVNKQLFLTVSENLKSFLLVVLNFVKLCFELEDVLASVTKCPSVNPIHPFGPKIMSLSGFSMSLAKYFYLNKVPIHTI